MDNLLTSIGNILEKLPVGIAVPALAVAVLIFAGWRAVKEERAAASSRVDGTAATLGRIEATLNGVRDTVGEVNTSVEILKDRKK